MDPNALLADLKDAHAPELISAWPLAPGWWLLLALIIVGLFALTIYGLRKWRKLSWKRTASQQFKQLRDDYLNAPSITKLIELNQLLKQSLCSARKTRDYLSISGETWAQALLSIHKQGQTILNNKDVEILSQGIYCQTTDTLNKHAMGRIDQWLNQLT